MGKLGSDGQGSGLCPTHEDHEPSLGIVAGEWHDYVWGCKRLPACPPAEVRLGLIDKYRIPAEWLGSYCTREYQPARPAQDDRGAVARLRADVADRDARLAAVDAVLRDPAIGRRDINMLRMRIQLAREGGGQMPTSYEEVIALGLRANAGRAQVYEIAARLSLSTG